MNRYLLKIICTTFLMVVGTITPQLLANNDAANLAKAQTWTDNTTNQTHFIENKGQIMQADGQPAAYVSYLLQRGNTNIYLLREGGIAYQFNRMHYPEGYQELMADLKNEHENMEKMQEMQKEIRLETFRMDMHLVDANPNAEIITENKSHDYTNYYTHDALFVHYYQKIIFKNIYSGIDWVIYTTEEGGMKYDFIVHSGADPSVIKMKFTHQEELYLDEKGNLIHGNRLGSFTEKAPISFQEDKSIATQFILKDNMLSFTLENYNPNLPLTIDPARIWGTYYGGSSDEYGGFCTTEGSGNVYLAGETYSTTNIAFGGHQNIYGVGGDAFLVKFNSSGVRLWSTYYGGNNREYIRSCATDLNGNVYLAGRTESTTNIASNGHQNTFGGGTYDGFIVKFNSLGVRQWSTYYGDSGDEMGLSCSTDNSGNVYFASTTTSTNNISSGGHQNTFGGGTYDGFLVKLNSSGVRLWSTYYGGGDNDYGSFCSIDSIGNIYLVGVSRSTNDIASGGYQNTNGGGSDAFLVKFNSSGVRLWGTYFGGSANDPGSFCTTDGNGNVYISGYTYSTNNIAFGGHQNTHGGGGGSDVFLAKFNSLGMLQWSTYYGGNFNESSGMCRTDSVGNIYLSGTTGSSSNISSNGYQNTHGGNQDAFLVKFDSSGVRQWGTYYGDTSNDYGPSCSIDNNGYVYLAGTTNSLNSIASGGHQDTIGGWGDAFLVKFRTNCHLTGTDVVVACDSFIWIDNNTYTSNNNTATFLMLNGASNSCDSIIYLNLTIYNSAIDSQSVSICQGDSILIGGIYQTTAGTYYDSLQTVNNCDSIVEITLSVDISLTAYFTKAIDPNDSLNLLITNLATGNNLQYLWDFGDGNTSTQAYPNHTYATIGVYNLCLTITDSLSGCSSIFCDSTTVMRTTGIKTIQVISPTTNIDEVDYFDNIILFPNPTQNTFILNLIETKSAQIMVRSIEGKIMYNKVINNNNVEIDASKWANGFYFVNVIIDNQQKVFKLIKQ